MDKRMQTRKPNFVHREFFGGRKSRVRCQNEAKMGWRLMLHRRVWKGLSLRRGDRTDGNVGQEYVRRRVWCKEVLRYL